MFWAPLGPDFSQSGIEFSGAPHPRAPNCTPRDLSAVQLDSQPRSWRPHLGVPCACPSLWAARGCRRTRCLLACERSPPKILSPTPEDLERFQKARRSKTCKSACFEPWGAIFQTRSKSSGVGEGIVFFGGYKVEEEWPAGSYDVLRRNWRGRDSEQSRLLLFGGFQEARHQTAKARGRSKNTCFWALRVDATPATIVAIVIVIF